MADEAEADEANEVDESNDANEVNEANEADDACTVRILHCDERPTAEDKLRLYYSRHELKMMNREANVLCILSRALPAIESSGTHLDRRDSFIEKLSPVAKDTPCSAFVRQKSTSAGDSMFEIKTDNLEFPMPGTPPARGPNSSSTSPC